MENKDNRSKEKRVKMKQYCKPPQRNNASSSSGQKEKVRGGGIIDVADSSDDRGVCRNAWVSSTVPSQSRRYSLTDIELDNDDQNAQITAGDFNVMSQLPTAAGANFQFSSEKNWDSPEGGQVLDSTAAREYFTLNLKMLNKGLHTIPFYKRMDYPSSMFSGDQLLSMEKAAEIAEKQFHNVLQEHTKNPQIKINNDRRKTGSAKSKDSDKDPKTQDEIDELLSLNTTNLENVTVGNKIATVDVPSATEGSAENPTSPSIAGDNKDDIQHWLDNVLDE